MKSQHIASENLRIVFPPFLNTATQGFHTSADVATLVAVKPNGDVFTPALTLVRDTNTDHWAVEIAAVNFEIGTWTFKATSDGANAQPQYQSLVWGDYLDDIFQATMGRWRILSNQLLLYKDDGVTILRTFDLKDAIGNPTSIQVFERDPV